MNSNYLDFEQLVLELDERIDALKETNKKQDVNTDDEISSLIRKRNKLMRNICSKLTPWQVAKMARHPLRPYTLDYIELIIDDFELLEGDRMFAADKAIVGGIGKLGKHPVLVLGHQKGRDTKSKLKHNFGMPKPEGYRKAKRLAQLAERFGLPVITLIDTPGAYPGIDAEARGQSEAIASCLQQFSALKTPILSVVIGEGGSGGALAIGVGDYLAMLQFSVYSVISPEGCASILFKDAEHAPQAAEAMGITANKLLELKMIDEVLPEPVGGAHRNIKKMAGTIKATLIEELLKLKKIEHDELIDRRYQRLKAYGALS